MYLRVADADSRKGPIGPIRSYNNDGFSGVLLVLFCVAMAAVLSSTAVFQITSQLEQSSFEADFDSIATNIVEGLKSDLSLRFWMASSLANAVTMMIEASGNSSTAFTLPPSRWEKITQEARFNGNALAVTWSPIISTEEERRTFEEFVKPHEFDVGLHPECFLCGSPDRAYSNPWDLVDLVGFGTIPCGGLEKTGRRGVIPASNCAEIADALVGTCICSDLPTNADVPQKNIKKSKQIFHVEPSGIVVESSDGAPYCPIWQASTLDVIDMPIMYNQLSEPVREKALQIMQKTSMPTMSNLFVREGPYYEKFAGSVGYTSSVLYYPVFDPNDQDIVGSIGLELALERFYTGAFPYNSRFVDLVVENSCGQSHTFHVDPQANALQFVGEGDLHDESFGNEMARMTSFAEEFEDLVNFSAPRSTDQSSLDYCRFRFSVYPTAALKDEYVSTTPRVYASMTVAVFGFLSLAIILINAVVSARLKNRNTGRF